MGSRGLLVHISTCSLQAFCDEDQGLNTVKASVLKQFLKLGEELQKVNANPELAFGDRLRSQVKNGGLAKFRAAYQELLEVIKKQQESLDGPDREAFACWHRQNLHVAEQRMKKTMGQWQQKAARVCDKAVVRGDCVFAAMVLGGRRSFLEGNIARGGFMGRCHKGHRKLASATDCHPHHQACRDFQRGHWGIYCSFPLVTCS